jgi:hypothetical protein
MERDENEPDKNLSMRSSTAELLSSSKKKKTYLLTLETIRITIISSTRGRRRREALSSSF